MNFKRILFTLLYSNKNFYLSRNFSLQKVGNINWLKKNYGFGETCKYIDEIIVLLITKNPSKKEILQFCDDLNKFRENIFVPITIGGGIRRIEDAHIYFENGADKIIINTLAHENHEELEFISKNFGSQSISVMIDYKKIKSKYISFSNAGTKVSYEVSNFFKILNKLNFGELILNSIDKDGTGFGFDRKILNFVPSNFKHPLLLMGGAGKPDHFEKILKNKKVSGAITANLFNFLGSGLELSRNHCINKKVKLIKFLNLNNNIV